MFFMLYDKLYLKNILNIMVNIMGLAETFKALSDHLKLLKNAELVLEYKEKN